MDNEEFNPALNENAQADAEPEKQVQEPWYITEEKELHERQVED